MPPSPATPLQQLSPDRMNQQRIPASPSLPNNLSSAESKVSRQSIDVQSKVAFINSLNQAGSPTRQQGSSAQAALQRALMGREEAESALRISNVQLAEAETRQQKISERVENLMDELQALRKRQVHERQVFEKEVRKARKDAFRAGSGLVKVQEDLKDSRTEARNLKAEVQRERHEKEKSRQEAFERAYTLAGLLEEVEMMREKLQAVEATREAEIIEQRSRRLQEEEEHQGLAESSKQDEKVTTALRGETIEESRQTRQNRFERDPAAISAISVQTSESARSAPESELSMDEISPADEELAAELEWEKELRIRAEDMVHFLQMECQFQACACRRAERKGTRFVHDKEYDARLTAQSAKDSSSEHERKSEADAAVKPGDPQQDMHQMQEDMFSISRPSQQPAQEVVNGPYDSPKGAVNYDSPKEVRRISDSPIPSPEPSLSASSPGRDAAMDSSQLASNIPSSIKNASSPAIGSAEDMTYQSPLRSMMRPKSACAIPVRDLNGSSVAYPTAFDPRSPTTTGIRSPSASPQNLVIRSKYCTPQRPGLRVVRSQTTTTMMVPLRNDDDDVFSPQHPQQQQQQQQQPATVSAKASDSTSASATQFLRTPGTPVSREAALAQIRARRDRARSVAGRWITATSTSSCPSSAGGPGGTPGGAGSARRGLMGGVRDVSAPGRF